MEKMTLKEIAKALGCECQSNAAVSAVCTDTRKITENCLFVAIEGARFDAHDFVQQAVDSGACAVVCHKPTPCTGTVLMVEDTRRAYLDIAGYYRDKFDLPLIGLTGSVGKTTTKDFTALALGAKYKTLKTEGNFNNDIGMPATLLRLDKTYEAAVIEMGMNHFGEIHNLVTRSKPTMGIITNIGVAHIENLGSRDGILKAKLEIIDGLKDGAPLILNGDDDKLCAVKLKDRKIYFFSLKNKNADFYAYNLNQNNGKTSFLVNWEDKTVSLEIPTIGIHNVYNALAAFAAGVLNGVNADAVKKAFSEYVPTGMRQKTVNCGGFTVIEDCYNASPDSMHAAINTLADMKASKRIAVLADMLELGSVSQTAHREIGALCAEKGIDCLLAYGTEAENYVSGAVNGGMKEAKIFYSQDDLLNALINETEQNSVILFKGSRGMHLEETIQALYERNDKNE